LIVDAANAPPREIAGSILMADEAMSRHRDRVQAMTTRQRHPPARAEHRYQSDPGPPGRPQGGL